MVEVVRLVSARVREVVVLVIIAAAVPVPVVVVMVCHLVWYQVIKKVMWGFPVE